MSKFGMILTNAGIAKVINAQMTQEKMEIVQFAVGDANGTPYTPVQEAVSLRNEKWRGPVAAVEIEEKNPHWIVVTCPIPAQHGGFMIHEAGLYDAHGDLIAIGRTPESYKPVLSEGAAKDFVMEPIIEVSNASSVTLRIDPNVIQASRDYVDNKIKKNNNTASQQLNSVRNVLNTQLYTKKRRRPLLVFIDDDASAGVWTKIKPLVDELQFKVSLAVMPQMIDTAGYCTSEQLKTMHDSGYFEMLNHTWTGTQLATLNDNEQQMEILQCKNWLDDKGFTSSSDIVVYPGGSTNDNVRKNMRKVARAAITIDNGNSLLNYPTPLHTYNIQRVYLERGAANAKAKIDQAIAENALIVIGMHVFYDTWSQALLREVVEYAQGKIEIVSMSEALEAFGNTLEIGDSMRLDFQNTQFINCDGETFGADKSKVIHRIHGVDGWQVKNDTPASYFPFDKTVITTYLSSASVGLPVNGAATLKTESYGTNTNRYWTYQEFRASASDKVYKRHWIVVTSKWSAWREVGDAYHYKAYNSITATTPIDDFVSNGTTITAVSSAQGFLNSAGVVETYNFGAGFSYQKLKKHNSNVEYTRTWLSTTNAWGEWEKTQKGKWGYVSVPFGTIAANAYKAVSVTIDGVALNDIVTINPPATLPGGLIVSNPIVTAANTVQLRVYNTSASDVSSSDAWKYVVLKWVD